MPGSPRDLKRLDVVVALWLAMRPEREKLPYDRLAAELECSPSQAHGAVRNLQFSRLAAEQTRRVHSAPLLEFLGHGLRFAFPARPGTVAIGLPTAHSAPPLRDLIRSDEQFVWPHEQGNVRGLAIQPLHKSVPRIAERDPEFHELLALTDALRVGRARERAIALEEIRRRLKPDRA